MHTGRNQLVAVVGAGPRGTSVTERLISQWDALPDGQRRPLEIHLIDPEPPGPGHVWRPDQSRLFLMNTPSLFPSVVPVGRAADGLAPSVVDRSFNDWRTEMTATPAPSLSAGDLEELARLGGSDFPSRALYGRYLQWTYQRLVAHCRDGITVTHHATDALKLARASSGYRVALADGTALIADAVVLALGHLPAQLNPEQDALRDGAARYSLNYWPPAVPADIDWTRIPARKPVLIRGLGLNFFDVMIQLSEGRGGHFAPDETGRLQYHPTGREPLLIAASRRGVPYRAKAQLDSYLPRSVSLRHCTVPALRSFAGQGIRPGFDHDIWPLLHRDVLGTYYATMARVAGAGPADPDAFLIRLHAALDVPGPGWATALEELLAEEMPAAPRLDVEGLARPFAGRRFADAQEYQEAVLPFLDADVDESVRGEDSPLKMAIGAMNAGRTVIKTVVADGGLTDQAWMSELRGWFEPLVEGLASGPPAVRIAQLAALARAGVVRFVGPNPQFTIDAGTGRFVASSPWVDGEEATASHLVDAMMPPNRAVDSLSPLLRQLLEDGLVRAKVMMAEDGAPVTSAGLDVTLPPYRAIDGAGREQPDLYVIGLQLASVQWGTAIAAEAHAPADAGGRTLRDADGIAAAILTSGR
ncbi:FAD/NAD(P)-binding protein [Arthrobacter sp. 260]|uniref:FAD/NAD(P)-binding protein n=1 Tax=Arthrobacter sp. 260 TaxID=2735314 RepID=UPI001490991B|nr:FAD/NAD(P)-binding protein [Arthrobacter sp. 260]NOJ60515.1 FAD/NAD(P)-binding protein [Arthrobacter sp. 260]